MNQNKLKDYKLTGSFHTLEIQTDGIAAASESYKQAVSSNTIKEIKDGIITKTILNLNKIDGDIFNYPDFRKALDAVITDAGIKDYAISRADFRLDNYDKEHYQMFSKLNKYLISMLAVTYSVTNAYKTEDLFSQKLRSIAIKNKYFEIENYDKEAESHGLDMACSRLEERTKSFSDDLKREFTQKWFARWDKAVKNKNKVEKRYNDELEKIYKAGKDAFPVQFRSLTDFLIQYQNCIFSKRQMIDLLSRFDEVGADKAATRAKNHKQKYGIEYFSDHDIERAIAEIKRATLEFFDKPDAAVKPDEQKGV